MGHGMGHGRHGHRGQMGDMPAPDASQSGN
jgi:hypothetical protein